MKDNKTKKQSAETTQAQDDRMSGPDPLLESLVFLTKHYGRAKSPESLVAGLAYSGSHIGSKLFCEAADKIGLKAQVIKKSNLGAIPNAVLPAVIILKNEQACVLVSKSANGKKAKIYLPETKAVKDIAIQKLKQDYAGYAIYVHPRSEFNDPKSHEIQDDDNHWFWGIVNESRGIYGMVLIAAVFINLFGLVSPLFIMNVYDRVIPNAAIETGWALGLGALAAFFFDFTLRNIRGYFVDIAGRKIDVIAGRRIYDQVLNMRLEGRPQSSGVFANMLRDFDSVRDFFTSATITALVDLPFSFLFLFVIYKLAGPEVAILLGCLIVTVMVVGFILQVPLKRLVRKSVKSSEAKHGLLIESIHGLETIKSIGGDGRFRARYGDYISDNALWSQKSRFVSALGVNVATFLQQTASILVVLLGMYLVRDSELSMGGLIASVILGGRAIAPIGQIANLMARYHQAGSALKTLNRIMANPVERPAGTQFLNRPDLEGKIKLNKVSFAYPMTNRKVLDTISFEVKAGEKVGVIGRVGSGKSTIAKLLVGLYQPLEGSILIDDTDYNQIDPADLRRQTAYISQDIFLFSGSIRDNIAATMPQATDDQILDAAKRAGAHEFISRHPMGYDAPVGENGDGLSGGQKQAVALARAMLLNPRVMICDEPTNAMDIQAEQLFMKYIKDEVKGKTLILITHKHTMLPLVDRLILMDQGRVIMDGPRDKVIKALNEGNIEVPKQ